MRLLPIPIRLNMMARSRSEMEKAAGKLTSAIQKEWGNELGEFNADISEYVMSLAPKLHQAQTADAMISIIGARSLKQYLGKRWMVAWFQPRQVNAPFTACHT